MNEEQGNQNEGNISKDVVASAANEHPVATDIGAVAGVAAGAIIGSALGPLGALTGAVIGGSTGVIAGKGIAAAFDPTAEEAYWARKHKEREDIGLPEYADDFSFDDFSPAYRLGWQMFAPGVSFESVESDLMKSWELEKGSSRLSWDQARQVARMSWSRLDQAHRP